jgi:hypothetical protein
MEVCKDRCCALSDQVVSGPYATRIFVDLLGAAPESVIHNVPLPDFGGLLVIIAPVSCLQVVTPILTLRMLIILSSRWRQGCMISEPRLMAMQFAGLVCWSFDTTTGPKHGTGEEVFCDTLRLSRCSC